MASEIISYQLLYYGKNASSAEPTARIFFYDNNNVLNGRISFYSKWSEIPDNSLYGNEQSIYLEMHENKIPIIVDMLRNEKPCFAYYTTPTNANVSTESNIAPTEPVGEGE